ncbi:Cu/Ag efflux pump CusA [Sphingomonas sp. BE137]|nr:Cu/Ag efflux pump CusA [Sphingomonas sp. BE137]
MKFPHFFIDRPIFAAVLSILIVVFGVIVYPSLPVAQYPQIAPPTVVVSATFPARMRKRSPKPSPRRSRNRSTALRT